MQNAKYHLLNIASVLLFSYITAITINQFFEYIIAPSHSINPIKSKVQSQRVKKKNWEDYQVVISKPFFKKKEEESLDVGSGGPAEAPQEIKELVLLGTITGPSSIARALIKKRSEKEPTIFRLWKDVYGHKLIRIDNRKIFLKSGETVHMLDMFAKDEKSSGKGKSTTKTTKGKGKDSKNISRSEIKQKVLNNMDNALRGLRAGPYRVDGKVQGYKIFRIKPYNILYKLGARNGDIIKRVNGHPVNSTEKLYKMWQNMKGDTKINVDLVRGGKTMTFDFNITD